MLNCVGMIAAGLGIYFFGHLRDLKIDLRIVFDFGAVLCLISALIYCSLKASPGALRSDQVETAVESPS
jgi:hypothetical protein